MPKSSSAAAFGSTHGIGVLCALGAGAWLGAAEAPTKLVNSGLSPYSISLCMVAGVFTARWTVPTLLKGTRQVFADLSEHRHLIPIAILAGMLWAVANTLTVFAIRDVGLAIAFPLWNTNSLVGIFWGRVLFGELKGASGKNVAKVVLGALAIVAAAVHAGLQHHSWRRAARGARGRRRAGGRGREPVVGNDVHPLPQGLHQRYESAIVCDSVHHRRARRGAHARAGAGPQRDARAHAFNGGAPHAVLALSGRLCLGGG